MKIKFENLRIKFEIWSFGNIIEITRSYENWNLEKLFLKKWKFGKLNLKIGISEIKFWKII